MTVYRSYHISNEIKNEEKDCARKREIKQFYQQQKLLKAPQTVRVGAKKVYVKIGVADGLIYM